MDKAKGYLKALLEYCNVEKCKHCECLHGAFTQLKLDCPELKVEIDKISTSELHKCLGCEPCPPADLWVKYLKEKEV